MELNSNVTIALKKLDNNYTIYNLNLFNLQYIDEGNISINKIKNNALEFKVCCHLCEKEHIYIYSIKEIVKKDLIVLGCEKLGIPLVVLGKKEEVGKMIYPHNYVNYKINVIL